MSCSRLVEEILQKDLRLLSAYTPAQLLRGEKPIQNFCQDGEKVSSMLAPPPGLNEAQVRLWSGDFLVSNRDFY